MTWEWRCQMNYAGRRCAGRKVAPEPTRRPATRSGVGWHYESSGPLPRCPECGAAMLRVKQTNNETESER